MKSNLKISCLQLFYSFSFFKTCNSSESVTKYVNYITSANKLDFFFMFLWIIWSFNPNTCVSHVIIIVCN